MATPLRVVLFVIRAISAARSFSAPAHTINPHRYLADAGATTVAITVAARSSHPGNDLLRGPIAALSAPAQGRSCRWQRCPSRHPVSACKRTSMR